VNGAGTLASINTVARSEVDACTALVVLDGLACRRETSGVSGSATTKDFSLDCNSSPRDGIQLNFVEPSLSSLL
jgi:hypothetical protein